MKKDTVHGPKVNPIAKAAMDQLLGDSIDGAEYDYDGIDLPWLARLIVECARRNLMVSVWYSAVDYALYISIRAGDARRVYSYTQGAQVAEGCRKILLQIGYDASSKLPEQLS